MAQEKYEILANAPLVIMAQDSELLSLLQDLFLSECLLQHLSYDSFCTLRCTSRQFRVTWAQHCFFFPNLGIFSTPEGDQIGLTKNATSQRCDLEIVTFAKSFSQDIVKKPLLSRRKANGTLAKRQRRNHGKMFSKQSQKRNIKSKKRQ